MSEQEISQLLMDWRKEYGEAPSGINPYSLSHGFHWFLAKKISEILSGKKDQIHDLQAQVEKLKKTRPVEISISDGELKNALADLTVENEKLRQQLADNDLAFEHSQEVIKKQEETIEKLQKELAAAHAKNGE